MNRYQIRGIIYIYRERKRQTDRQTEILRETWTDRKAERQVHRQTETDRKEHVTERHTWCSRRRVWSFVELNALHDVIQ